MSRQFSHGFCSIALLSFLAATALNIAGCSKSTLPAIRAELPLDSAAQLSPGESRSIKDLPASELLQRGGLSLANADFRLAAVYFSGALDKDPKSVPARLGLGQAALAAGDERTARTLIDQVLTVDPDSVPALTARGRIQRNQGHLPGAIADFTRSLEMTPENAVLMTDLAMTYDRLPEQVLQAEALYRRVLELNPDSAAARNNLGFNCLLQNRAGEAVAILSGALALDSKNPRILANLAAAYLLNGDPAKALKLFRQAVGEAEAHNNIGYLYMTQSRWDDAESSFNKALELSPRYYHRAGANLERLHELRVAAEDRHPAP